MHSTREGTCTYVLLTYVGVCRYCTVTCADGVTFSSHRPINPIPKHWLTQYEESFEYMPLNSHAFGFGVSIDFAVRLHTKSTLNVLWLAIAGHGTLVINVTH